VSRSRGRSPTRSTDLTKTATGDFMGDCIGDATATDHDVPSRTMLTENNNDDTASELAQIKVLIGTRRRRGRGRGGRGGGGGQLCLSSGKIL